ncbi:MAG: GerW family sporulation protein [Lachnospiraceae bacterium]|nr:GerW family sporulation protein [Lachnospiraceae bacterium]
MTDKEKKNGLGDTVEALFQGLDNFISTKTVVGEAVKFDDGTIILPLVDVNFGVGAGAFNNQEKNKQNAGGGLGGSMQPSAVLVIQNGTTKLVNIKNQDTVTKILDMVPDFVNKFLAGKDQKDDDLDILE